ncbi:MAG: bifunctional phosphopantothenoylcysteine decarboxylase/phosphopantothenate--cysteine ligase CoaBC [Christensenellales bacterium]|jgi:phosphopantothenoylcysteine decarboxylase/phosphopantothenate--cysteine ligase
MNTKKAAVLGISGGIAAYKAAEISSRLTKAGLDVFVIMTDAAKEFITPLTLETITKNPVACDMFQRGDWDVEHIALAKRADVFIIAPATANIIGKMALGIADNMLSTTVMATRAPLVIAPAMNTKMYEHEAVRQNIETLKRRGAHIVEPGSGMLACGDIGAGRLAEPEQIVEAALKALNIKNDFSGKHLLITAGPTREQIDPIRFISNKSSGKMGYALAEAAKARGADVTLVSGPVALKPPAGVKLVIAETTDEMLHACKEAFESCDAVVMAAAPADYRPAKLSERKIKKTGDAAHIELIETPDILKALSAAKKGQKLIGFAAETDDVIGYAWDKLKKKGLDMIAANDVREPGAGFDVDTNKVTLISESGSIRIEGLKIEVADRILDELHAIF